MKKGCFLLALLLMLCTFAVGCKEDRGDNPGKITTQSKTTTTVTSTTNATTTTQTTTTTKMVPTTTTSATPVQVTQTGQIKPGSWNASKLEGLATKKNGWGPGRSSNHKQPSYCLNAQAQYGKYNAFYVGDAAQKNIYLTFDEGYEYGLSDDILDTLKEKGVSATFFITMDFAKSEPALVKRMIAEGHTVGNHSTTHPSFPGLSVEKMRVEADTLHQYVKQNFGYDMQYFRFPMGEFSEQSLAAMQMYGYKSVFWSFAYKDWVTNDQPEAASSLKLLKEQLHPGAIYLLHAVSKTNATILGDFIDGAKAEGYTFAKMGL